MNYITFLKKTILSAMLVGAGLQSYAQNNEEKDTKIIIQTTEITNGDTVNQKKVLTGKEAESYLDRHHFINDMNLQLKDVSDQNKELEIEIERIVDEAIELSNEAGNHQHEREVIVRKYSRKNNGEVIERVYDAKNGNHTLIAVGDDLEIADRVEILEDEIIITHADGSEQVIDLNDGKKHSQNENRRKRK